MTVEKRYFDKNEFTVIPGLFKILKETEKAICFHFHSLKKDQWFPKSMIVDERFNIGRTFPESQLELEVNSWFFHTQVLDKMSKKQRKYVRKHLL